MTKIGPLGEVPVACTLTPATGKAQLERWQEFDAQYALAAERSDTRLTIHYAKSDDSVRLLTELVEVERTCCTFVSWSVDDEHDDLQLIVTGTPEQLAALNVGR